MNASRTLYNSILLNQARDEYIKAIKRLNQAAKEELGQFEGKNVSVEWNHNGEKDTSTGKFVLYIPPENIITKKLKPGHIMVLIDNTQFADTIRFDEVISVQEVQFNS